MHFLLVSIDGYNREDILELSDLQRVKVTITYGTKTTIMQGTKSAACRY